MTWSELKAAVEASGMRDTDVVRYFDWRIGNRPVVYRDEEDGSAIVEAVVRIKNAGTEPILVRAVGKGQIEVPRNTGTGALFNAGRYAVTLFYSDGEYVATLEPGEMWPK